MVRAVVSVPSSAAICHPKRSDDESELYVFDCCTADDDSPHSASDIDAVSLTDIEAQRLTIGKAHVHRLNQRLLVISITHQQNLF